MDINAVTGNIGNVRIQVTKLGTITIFGEDKELSPAELREISDVTLQINQKINKYDYDKKSVGRFWLSQIHTTYNNNHVFMYFDEAKGEWLMQINGAIEPQQCIEFAKYGEELKDYCRRFSEF